MATLIMGLGNPGGEYSHTRHNCGWMVLDELEGRAGSPGPSRGPAKVRTGTVDGFNVVLARPTTYMNLSGRAGVHLVRVLGVPIPDVVVVHDDVDLPFGRLRLRRGGSAGGNRGVRSLIESWQTPDFIRVRVGIGRPPPARTPSTTSWTPSRSRSGRRCPPSSAVPPTRWPASCARAWSGP